MRVTARTISIIDNCVTLVCWALKFKFTGFVRPKTGAFLLPIHPLPTYRHMQLEEYWAWIFW